MIKEVFVARQQRRLLCNLVTIIAHIAHQIGEAGCKKKENRLEMSYRVSASRVGLIYCFLPFSDGIGQVR